MDRVVTIPARGSSDIALHEGESYGTSPDSYGVVVLQSPQAQRFSAELLRVKPLNSGAGVDFAAPTEVR